MYIFLPRWVTRKLVAHPVILIGYYDWLEQCKIWINLRSAEETVVIQPLMCSFGNDWLLALLHRSQTGNQLRQPQVSVKTSAGPPLLISQPSHLCNYSVFFERLQKPPFFSLRSVRLDWPHLLDFKKSSRWGCGFCVFRHSLLYQLTPWLWVSTLLGGLMQALKTPSLSACVAVFLPPSCSLWVQSLNVTSNCSGCRCAAGVRTWLIWST